VWGAAAAAAATATLAGGHHGAAEMQLHGDLLERYAFLVSLNGELVVSFFRDRLQAAYEGSAPLLQLLSSAWPTSFILAAWLRNTRTAAPLLLLHRRRATRLSSFIASAWPCLAFPSSLWCESQSPGGRGALRNVFSKHARTATRRGGCAIVEAV
jgi:hypothetical protein